MGFINVICLLELLEGAALEQVYARLRPAAQALRAAIDSNVTFGQCEDTGDWSSASYGSLLAAKLFGHDEAWIPIRQPMPSAASHRNGGARPSKQFQHNRNGAVA